MEFTMIAILGVATAFVVYPFAVYPALLILLQLAKRKQTSKRCSFGNAGWPTVSVIIPVHNEGHQLGIKVDDVLSWEYPDELLQVVVATDGCTDDSAPIARDYASRGVELLELPNRVGKTAAENAAIRVARGEIVVNTDASVRAGPDVLRELVRPFGDPGVGATTSRCVMVSERGPSSTVGDSLYNRFDFWLREVESNSTGVVGASGALFACRRSLHTEVVPVALSRDFLVPLLAIESGMRTVFVPDAISRVPRTAHVRTEFSRKQRTMTRGLQTLYHKRHLLNPFRYGMVAFALFSHKLARWLVPPIVCLTTVIASLLLPVSDVAKWYVGCAAGISLLSLVGWFWPEYKGTPRILSLPTYVVSSLIAGLLAWLRAVSGDMKPIWEPTRRPLKNH